MSDLEQNIHDRLVSLQNNIKNLSGNVVLVGDIMLDRYIHGYANNLNSRAPVPVLKETHREEDVGAAAHVARGLDNIGLDAILYGVVGDDRSGSQIISLLKNDNIECSGIAVIEGRTTTVKTRMIAGREYLISNQQLLLRWDIEDDSEIDNATLSAIMDSAISRISDSDVLVISDYGQGVVTDESATRVMKAAKLAGVPIICDPKLTGLHRTHGADWVIFQTRGLDLMAKRLASANSADAAAKLVADHGWKHLVVLGGENGGTVYNSDGTTAYSPCNLESPRGVIGIIDAVGVALAAALTLGLSVEDVAHLANAACECIMSADDHFTLTSADLADRLGEIAWKMQISQR